MLIRLIFGCLALIGAAALAYWLMQPREMRVDVAMGDIRSALAAEIAERPEVGLLPRASFERVDVELREDGLWLTASGRWFSVGAGGYTDPIITLEAVIPAEAAAWRLQDGGFSVAGLDLVRAQSGAVGQTAERPESGANRAWWGDALGTIIDRLPPFQGFDLDADVWRISEVAVTAGGLVFVLQR